jgi:hypothetical protein
MATRIYFLRNDKTTVSVSVTPVTIGIASTVVKLKKSGGSIVDVGDSGRNATGKVNLTSAGKSSDLLNAVLVVTTIVNLTAVPKNQWDVIFQNLRITYHLEGGVDRVQDFNVDNDDKTRIMENKFIIATKAIKFNTHDNA